jgi:hypothetical protein
MCSFTYSWYHCNHDYYIWYAYPSRAPSLYTDESVRLMTSRANSIEVCPSRLMSSYSYDVWSIDMCKNMNVYCDGFSNYCCTDCSEDVALEYELDEW